MGELINGRTPEEIKRVLEWAKFACGDLVCEECPYYENVCSHESYEKIAPDALALIEHLEAKVPRWISVEERLPENEKDVIIRINREPGVTYYAVACRKECLFDGWETNDEDFNCHYGDPKVTHWMPLPDPLEVKHD